jgi:serine/threonine-protein kinase
VKPGNVMLSDTNQVKVMDFGIARALASGQATMTQTSAVIGTAQYLSPEQARGETVDARSDVYAVGCVLYELLVGHPPFTGDNPVSVAYQHVREEARPPSELNPNVPDSVDAVIMKALAKNPENRYHSAGEMREDLIRAARGQAVMAPAVMSAGDRTQMLAGPDSTAPITPIATSSSKRRPWLIALGVILALVAVTAASWGIMQAMEASSKVEVPNVEGQLQADAEKTLKDDGFEVKVETEVATDPKDTNIGYVTDQTPDAYAEVDEGATVTLTVMIAPENVKVQDVVGDEEAEARSKLEAQGLEVEVVQQDSPEPSGEVLTQDPKAGTEVPPTTKVTLTVSSGGQATVPNVIGMTVDLAESTLTEAGFTVDIEYGNQGDQVDVVYEQDQGEGSTLAKGSTVVITAQGVVITWDAATAPADLQATLQGLGLTANIEGDPAAETIASVANGDGEITSGMAVAPGSTVTITAAEDNGGGGGDDETSESPSETCGALDPPPCNNDGNN